jgi:excisionase family DNA binding protein
MEKLITPEAVAGLLSVSPRTVKEWLRRGDLKGVKAGTLWRIRESDLDSFLHKDPSSVKGKNPHPDKSRKGELRKSGGL